MQVLSPRSLEDACAMLGGTGGSPARGDGRTRPIPIAGCTDVLVHWPGNLAAKERTYLDLTGVEQLRGLCWTDTHLELGALATYWDVIGDERCGRDLPLLVAAARTVGAIQIQSRGTWAGNIVNASPAADGVPALMACDASVVLVSRGPDGKLVREEVRLDEFYLGYKKMRRSDDQLVERIRIPIRTHRVSIFEKVGARRAQAITKVGVAIAHSDAGWRIIANSAAPTVRRCRAVEHLLESGSPVRSPLGFAGALAQDISPIDDIRSTAAYRRTVLARVLYFALKGKAPAVAPP